MGVKNLNSLLLLGDYRCSSSLSSLRGETVVVDVAYLLVQFTKHSAHIYQMFHFINEQDFDDELEVWLNEWLQLFRKLDITIIFVGEGDRNPCKKGTNDKRAKLAADAKIKLDSLLQNPNSASLHDVNNRMKDTTQVSGRLWYSLRLFCDKHNIMLLSGVQEADGQLIALVLQDIASAIITVDTDIIPLGFGSSSLYLSRRVLIFSFIERCLFLIAVSFP